MRSIFLLGLALVACSDDTTTTPSPAPAPAPSTSASADAASCNAPPNPPNPPECPAEFAAACHGVKAFDCGGKEFGCQYPGAGDFTAGQTSPCGANAGMACIKRTGTDGGVTFEPVCAQ